MSILSSEIKWFRAASQSDVTPAQNGGRMTLTEIVSNIKNNLFSDVSQAQRLAGVTHERKAFIGIRNAANLPLIDPRISIESGTPGDDYVLISAGTQDDTQATRTFRPYGYGVLAEDATAAGSSIVVTVEHAAYEEMNPNPFQAGDTIRIDARATINDTGDYEYRLIDSVSYDGDELTITLEDVLEHSYTAADGVHVASVILPGEIAASVGTVTVNGGSTYTGTITTTAMGAIPQTWTVTVTNAATGALSLSGDTLGAGLATGAKGVDFAPNNPTTGSPYFTLPASGWGGTPVTGDTLEFTTAPAAAPIWYRRVVPTGAAAIASSPVAICIEGETS